MVGIFHCLLVAINFHAYISVLITVPKYLGLAVFYAIRRLLVDDWCFSLCVVGSYLHLHIGANNCI